MIHAVRYPHSGNTAKANETTLSKDLTARFTAA